MKKHINSIHILDIIILSLPFIIKYYMGTQNVFFSISFILSSIYVIYLLLALLGDYRITTFGLKYIPNSDIYWYKIDRINAKLIIYKKLYTVAEEINCYQLDDSDTTEDIVEVLKTYQNINILRIQEELTTWK